MIKYALFDKNNRIISLLDKPFENCVEVDAINVREGFDCCKYLVSFMQTEAYREMSEIYNLRMQREQECFSVINRGTLWYDTLTDEQKEELKTWYNAWLKVTETRIIPETPKWL